MAIIDDIQQTYAGELSAGTSLSGIDIAEVAGYMAGLKFADNNLGSNFEMPTIFGGIEQGARNLGLN